jgi:diguanylate cyclase (GGDEF)-like protein/PAS domain S-box-containing protein
LQVSRSHAARHLNHTRWRTHPSAIHLAYCFLAVGLATVSVSFFEREGGGANLMWSANGVLLTYLLLAPRWRWRGYLIAGIAAMLVGSALIGEPWPTNLLYNSLNLVEILIGALLLRRKSTCLPRFTDRNYLVRFIGSAVLAGPLVAGSILALVMALWRHTSIVKTLVDWLLGDGLGAAIIVPTFVAIFQARFTSVASLRKHWFYPLVLTIVTFLAFGQNNMPCLILILPLLVLLLMRVGLGGAALSTLLIATAASWFTLHGFGPFAASKAIDTIESSIQLQFFIACCIFLLYIVSVILEDRNAIEHRLQETAAIHALVTENSRDVILLADLDGRRTYISPAVEKMKGWKPEELLGEKLSDLAHPDDREKLEDTVRQLRLGAEGASIEYRCQKSNGEYIWLEASLRMFRDQKTGVPAGILSLMRDITERKHSEELLLKANEALEELAIVDALTGVANRRRFDECLAHEWSRAARLQEPLSLLIIDADSFKHLNDSLGHLAGDRCLKRIAQAATEAVVRPGDLVACFGGDEFVVVLPTTDAYGAEEIGRKIRANLTSLNAALDADAESRLTVSIGCATIVPRQEQHAATLIQIADEGLYNAKRNGRDQLCNATLQPSPLTLQN